MTWTTGDIIAIAGVVLGSGVVHYLWQRALKDSWEKFTEPVKQELHAQYVSLKAALDKTNEEIDDTSKLLIKIDTVLTELRSYSHEEVHRLAGWGQRMEAQVGLIVLTVKETEAKVRYLEQRINDLSGSRVDTARR